MQHTFALLKPDVANTPQEKELLADLKSAGFQITDKKRIDSPAPHIVATHLEELRTKIPEAFDRNLKYLMEGPVLALQLIHKDPKVDPISTLRKLAGATDPSKAKKGTLRHKYGNDILSRATKEKRGLRNAIHCSDSTQSAFQEYRLWFYGTVTYPPKHKFQVTDNNDGDELEIQFLENSQIYIRVAQCCVPRFEAEIPVSLLVDLLALWADKTHKSSWESNPNWKFLQTRIKMIREN